VTSRIDDYSAVTLRRPIVIAIVVSRADRASEHVGDRLLEIGEWEQTTDESVPDAAGGGTVHRRPGAEMRTFEDLHIHLEDPAAPFEAPGRDLDLLVFVSRHAGETGPLLTAHFTGNFGPAEYGGTEGGLARAAPAAQKHLFHSFREHAPPEYDVGIECTHHGPSDVGVPSLFAELGSGDDQWDDPDGARAVARSVLDLIEAHRRSPDDSPADVSPAGAPSTDLRGDDGDSRHVVGFGGGHYAPKFTRIVAETDWGVGHVGSDWQLAEMGSPERNRDVVSRAFEASDADHAVIEGEKPDLEATVEDLGHRVVSETWVREVGDRPLRLVEALEDAIASVEEGLRFGEVVPDGPPGNEERTGAVGDRPFIVHELPGDLLTRAQGIDHDAARAAIEEHAIAFETAEGGTRAAGAFAVTDRDALDALVESLAEILRERFEEVDVRSDAVVARETGFDPELAADRGVPEGPKFGALAAGNPVEIDGRTIEPDAVSREHEERFPI
jgi:D-aminoacyl-tRNA deacylase